MNSKNLKILLAKPGLDGHDVGVKVLAHALIENDFEVVYSGLRKSVEEIVQMAIDNEVDMIGLSILSGTHLVLCEQMKDAMKNANLSVPWIVGGNIPDDSIDALESIGATSAFPTGTTIEEVIVFCKKLAAKRKSHA